MSVKATRMILSSTKNSKWQLHAELKLANLHAAIALTQKRENKQIVNVKLTCRVQTVQSKLFRRKRMELSLRRVITIGRHDVSIER